MPTVVGPVLPEPYRSTVEAVWDDLVEAFGIDRYVNPYPHVTLYALEDDVDVLALAAAVKEAVADHPPLTVHTDGVGVFPGNHVWIPVAKSPRLLALQRDVVRAVADLGEAPVPFYEPHRWFPHVGLALELEDPLTADVVEFLLDYDFEWDVPIEDVAITRPPDEGTEYELAASIDL